MSKDKKVVQRALTNAEVKASGLVGARGNKPSYSFINVRVTSATKAKMANLAKVRKQSLSQAVAKLIERDILDQTTPKVWAHSPGAPGAVKRVDPTVTLTTEEIEAYERPQWLSAGKPVAREPWYVRLVNFFR